MLVTGILNRIWPFLYLPCHLNTHARQHFGFLQLDLIICKFSACVLATLHIIWSCLWFQCRWLTSFSCRKSAYLNSRFLPLMAFLNVLCSNFTEITTRCYHTRIRFRKEIVATWNEGWNCFNIMIFLKTACPG